MSQLSYFRKSWPCLLIHLVLVADAGQDGLTSAEDLWNRYDDIFPNRNRNAASHRWATHVLEHSSMMSNETLETLFGSFCAVSGSPVQPSKSNRWLLALPKVEGGSIRGTLNFCCWPCVCDAQEFIKVDTKTVTTLEGPQQYYFAVIGNPCTHPENLHQEIAGDALTLAEAAQDVNCEGGELVKSTLSDHGHVIIGMFFDVGPDRYSTQEASASNASEVDQQCQDRAKSGYHSGMGQIFRQVAGINVIHNIEETVLPASRCQGILSPSEQKALSRKVLEEPVVVFGIDGMRCTEAARHALESRSVCISKILFDTASPTWTYFKCLYPDERVGDTHMHSYVFIGGHFVGNGFRLLLDSSDPKCRDGGPTASPCLSPGVLEAKLSAAGARRTCKKDCAGILPASGSAKIDQDIASNSLVLYGWAGCPCTGLARARFQEQGVCYAENVWNSPDSATMKYLQCVYGDEHHSFVWAGGKFVGNGFMFEPKRMSAEEYSALLTKANAQVGMCQTSGDLSLLGKPLQSCTQAGDGTTTGWTRTGSCVWDPMDSGYHQVCVSMSQKFLDASRDHDSNDLSSVVAEGGHWCICAWAWASAVSRDPINMEGIRIDCERTNGRLRQVYELHIREGTQLRSPSGAFYKARDALEALNKKCPPAQNISEFMSGSIAGESKPPTGATKYNQHDVFSADLQTQPSQMRAQNAHSLLDASEYHSDPTWKDPANSWNVTWLVFPLLLVTALAYARGSLNLRQAMLSCWFRLAGQTAYDKLGSIAAPKLGKESDAECDPRVIGA